MNLKSILESILFVHGEPLSVKKMAKITEQEEEDVKKVLGELEKDYKERGLVLLKKEGGWQMGSDPKNTRYTEKLIKDDFAEELSRASLETIAIIAYKGPLTRIQVEHIRGVNSSFIIRNLLIRGLVERVENPKDARSFLYKISMDFLKYLGVASVNELPSFAEFNKQIIELGEPAAKDNGAK